MGYNSHWFDFEFPESLRVIGPQAFAYSDGHAKIFWPKNVEVVPDSAFFYYGDLYSADEMRYSDEDVYRLYLPPKVRKIGKRAFAWTHFKKIVVECETPPSVADDAFEPSSYKRELNPLLATLYVPRKDLDYYRTTEPWCGFSNICELEDYYSENYEDCWFDRTRRHEVDGVQYFLNDKNMLASVARAWDSEASCFDDTRYTGDIVLPSEISVGGKSYRVSTIDAEAFMNTINLRTVTLPDRMEAIGKKAFAGSGIRSFDWPGTVTIIPDSAFYGSKLESISINKGVKIIGPYAFALCKGMSRLVLPETMRELGYAGFYDCHISEIWSYSLKQPSIWDRAFENEKGNQWNPYDAIVYVPTDALDDYKKDDYWGKFKNIRGFDSTLVDETRIFPKHDTFYTLDGRNVMKGKFEDAGISKGIYVVNKSGRTEKRVK